MREFLYEPGLEIRTRKHSSMFVIFLAQHRVGATASLRPFKGGRGVQPSLPWVVVDDIRPPCLVAGSAGMPPPVAPAATKTPPGT